MAKVLVKDGYIDTDKQISSLSNIEYQKDSCIERVRELQEELNMLAIADPKILCAEDEDPIYTIRQRVSDIVESIRAELSEYNELDLLNDLIEEWDDNCTWGDKIVYSPSINTSTDEGFGNVVVKENDYEPNAKSGKTLFVSKDYTNISDYLKDCVTDLNNHMQSVATNGTWCIYIGNDLLVRKDGGFLFVDYESAKKWLAKAFNFEIINFISHRYLNEHPDFKQELLNAAKKGCTITIVKEIEDYFNTDMPDYKQMEKIVNYFKDLFINQLCTDHNISIRCISKLD